MKIKRFTAKDMRDAIRQVREEQGPDAVILSNRRVKEGVEVIAATDYDAALVQQAMSTLPKARVPKQPEAAARTAPSRAEAPQPSAGPNTRTAKPAPTNAKQPARPLLNSVAQHRETLQPATIKRAQPKRAQAIPLVDPEMAEVRRELMGVRTLLKMQLKREPSSEEMKRELLGMQALLKEKDGREDTVQSLRRELTGMRDELQNQLSRIAINDLKFSAPQHAASFRELFDMGVPETMARKIIENVPRDIDAQKARCLPLGMFAKSIPVMGEDLLDRGGVFALIGATGVGKTTTIAKLAARFGMRHGLRNVALVTTDCYRIGAKEQLYTYGRLLGVPVHAAKGGKQLGLLLKRLKDYKLVLIDTAGMSQRDQRLTAQFADLAEAGREVRSLLVLPANGNTSDLQEVARKFRAANPVACVISKADETTKLGGVLSVAFGQRLPISYVADGQRVPEDLHLAQSHRLVLRSVQQMHESRPHSAPMVPTAKPGNAVAAA